MKYEEMKIENLRPCMILANFITDEMPKYSYEDYLRDFVNQSPHFLKKSEGKLYQKPKSEAMVSVTAFQIHTPLTSNYWYLRIDYRLIGYSQQKYH